MFYLSQLEKKELITSDGVRVGRLTDIDIPGRWLINGVGYKMYKEEAKKIGKKVPFIGSPSFTVAKVVVKSVSDVVVLSSPLTGLDKNLTDYNPKTGSWRFLKMDIVCTGGRNVGRVTDVVFDNDLWKVQALLLKLNKEVVRDLKIDKPILRKPSLSISMDHISDIKDVVMLNIDLAKLGQILDEAPVQKA